MNVRGKYRGYPEPFLLQKHKKKMITNLGYDDQSSDRDGKRIHSEHTSMAWRLPLPVAPYKLDENRDHGYDRHPCKIHNLVTTGLVVNESLYA